MEEIRRKIKELAIGKKIRAIRQAKGLTLEDVSKRTGLSKALISRVENEQVSPPIATLLRIASALKVEISHFFSDKTAPHKVTVVRHHEVSSSRDSMMIVGKDAGYTYELLAFKKDDKHMEPFIVRFDLRKREEVALQQHKGEEFLHLLEGKLEFFTQDEFFVLEEGDSIYFDSSIPHGYRGIGEKPPKALVVVYAP
ncbi:MAG: Cro/Cl family transcriptional regulator [Deltaproteobacteria bacterium]|nr:MAG: Cro/Cl family transcriptional regulator [Deltaproteobacteria bacterium]